MAVSIYTGDCRQVLATLPPESVHACVTSPPYFRLRSYLPPAHPLKPLEIGTERTPEEYIANLVEVFRAVHRVLRRDGTLWVNIGDCYAFSGRGGPPSSASTLAGNGHVGGGPKLQGGTSGREASKAARVSQRTGCAQRESATGLRTYGLQDELKRKDLIGIPWMLAFALRADGWHLRQDIIWHKPGPMPESIQDRCTKAHEYLFLLSKSPRYYFDAAAIAEPAVSGPAGNIVPNKGADTEEMRTRAGLHAFAQRQRSRRNSFARETKESAGAHGQKPQHRPGREDIDHDVTRNKRDVWTVATTPLPDAHFAPMPAGLVQPCILAGVPEGGTVLDPFGGAGTVGLVADRLQRNAVLIDLVAEYTDMQKRRIANDAPLFTEINSHAAQG